MKKEFLFVFVFRGLAFFLFLLFRVFRGYVFILPG